MLRAPLDFYLQPDILLFKGLRLHHYSTSRARLRIAKKESLPETTPNVIHINHNPRVGDQSKAVGEPAEQASVRITTPKQCPGPHEGAE